MARFNRMEAVAIHNQLVDRLQNTGYTKLPQNSAQRRNATRFVLDATFSKAQLSRLVSLHLLRPFVHDRNKFEAVAGLVDVYVQDMYCVKYDQSNFYGA